jgi:hypothetical protein
MQCLTKSEAELWCEGKGLALDSTREPDQSKWSHRARKSLTGSNWARLTWVSGFIASFTDPVHEALFWVTQTGVWPSSENWSLFYRLRQSYGELRRIEEAPAQVFLRDEIVELTDFVEVGLICGWDFYILDSRRWVFVSHDEFVEFRTMDPGVEQLTAQFE